MNNSSTTQREAASNDTRFYSRQEAKTGMNNLQRISNTLTPEEERERLQLERKVERAFYEAGKSLALLRDKKLYRNTHDTFEAYCIDRFGFKRRHSYQLINAATVVDNLIQLLNLDQECAPVAHILPTAERQVRPLSSLEPEEQKEAWISAIEAAGGKHPNSRQIKAAVQAIGERTTQERIPNPHYVGEICRVKVNKNPELQVLLGYGGIVSEVLEFACILKTCQGDFLVSTQHLKSMNYTPSQTEQATELYQRLWKIREIESLDGAALNLLNYLEKQHSPSLSPIQEKLLQTLESFYFSDLK